MPPHFNQKSEILTPTITTRFSLDLFYIYYVFLYVLVYDYLSLCVLYSGISGFWLTEGILVILNLWVFWSLCEQG